MTAAFFSVLRSSLQHSHVQRVVSRIADTERRERIEPLLRKADSLAMSAGILEVACELAFTTELLVWISTPDAVDGRAVLLTLAIAVHNVPEGLAISAALRSRGASVLACAGWRVFSSLPQPLMAVPAFAFVDAFAPVLPYGLGFAAGAMVFMVLDELLPEAYGDARRDVIGLLVTLTMTGMILTQRFL